MHCIWLLQVSFSREESLVLGVINGLDDPQHNYIGAPIHYVRPDGLDKLISPFDFASLHRQPLSDLFDAAIYDDHSIGIG